MNEPIGIGELVFVGFNARVAALNRETGELVWTWKATKGSGYVSVLLDTDRLIVSVQGYTYCLDPITGAELWINELSGLGIGVATLASVAGQSASTFPAQHDTDSRSANY